MASSRLTLSQAKLRADAGRTKYSVIPRDAYEAFLGHSVQELERTRSRRDKHILTILRNIQGYKWNKGIVELLQELTYAPAIELTISWAQQHNLFGLGYNAYGAPFWDQRAGTRRSCEAYLALG